MYLTINKIGLDIDHKALAYAITNAKEFTPEQKEELAIILLSDSEILEAVATILNIENPQITLPIC